MYSCLFATAFDKLRNRPRALFDPGSLRARHANGSVRRDEVVLTEVEGNRSLKVFQLLAECVG